MMTSRTGPNGGRQCARAFTLIELILVMGVLAVVLAFAAPTLSRFFKGRLLDNEARRLLAVTQYGQSRAVSEAIPMVFWFDSVERMYGLRQESAFGTADPRALEYELGKDLKIEVLEGAVRRRSRNATELIRFLPDGSFSEDSPEALQLTDRDESTLWIALSIQRTHYEIQSELQNVRRR